MLKIENCSFYYNKNNPIIKNFSYKFESSKKTFLVGKSGSGKSTFLKILAKILTQQNGNIFYNGINLNEINFLNYTKNICRYAPQYPFFFESLNIIQYFKLISQNKFGIESAYLLDFLCYIFGKEILKINLSKLSGGQKKTISLFSCLINKAKIYLLDEPTSGLDERNGTLIYNFLVENIFKISKDSTLIISTHDKNLIQKDNKIINF